MNAHPIKLTKIKNLTLQNNVVNKRKKLLNARISKPIDP